MKVYLEIPHTNDDDVDLHSFDSMVSCMDYLREQEMLLDSEFKITTQPHGYPEFDYTHHNWKPEIVTVAIMLVGEKQDIQRAIVELKSNIDYDALNVKVEETE